MTTRRRQAGFTMIEVMIAILLTAVAVMGIVGLYIIENRGGNAARHTTEASVLAEDKMEFIRTQVTPIAPGTESNIDALGHAGGIYTRTWAATTTTFTTYTVNVTWNEDGPPQTVTLRSIRN